MLGPISFFSSILILVVVVVVFFPNLHGVFPSTNYVSLWTSFLWPMKVKFA